MLAELGLDDAEELVRGILPEQLWEMSREPPQTPDNRHPLPQQGLGEPQALAEIAALAAANDAGRHSLIGEGCRETVTPAAIRRNMLEQPGWYTAYTPYQAEISQGRLEMLLSYQQLVMDMTGLPLANASLLDEASAAAEAMALSWRRSPKDDDCRDYLVDAACFPQTLAVLRTRAQGLGVRLCVLEPAAMPKAAGAAFGALLQYPGRNGELRADTAELVAALSGEGPSGEGPSGEGLLVSMAADLLALGALTPPGELGAQIAVGSTQRFGLPMAGGGPHAAYIACQESMRRELPGRLVGVSVDGRGRRALRLALQTREQHIRRERATSNICTAQILPANLAAAWALHMGPGGVQRLCEGLHARALRLARATAALGAAPDAAFFDCLAWRLDAPVAEDWCGRAAALGIDLGREDAGQGQARVRAALGETTDDGHLAQLCATLAQALGQPAERGSQAYEEAGGEGGDGLGIPAPLRRTSPYLQHPIFSRYRSETALMRYLRELQDRDMALDRTMIGLGSCTMKLNAAAEMEPISWPGFAAIHPLAGEEHRQGYLRLNEQLESWLAQLTGFAAVSLQPNSGAQGEFAGLMAIRGYLDARGEGHRNLCLVPASAHGTNPASAAMASFSVLPVACGEDGSLLLDSLRELLREHGDRVGAMMITYPSTHGVYEEGIVEICRLVHEAGGQVYMDGANFNAMMGLVQPARLGADVCHLNLHKTFCIPHGGGGPGVGPVCVAEHLRPWLPGDPADSGAGGAVASYGMGSAGILPISWMFVRMMGREGLRRAAVSALLSANYLAARLQPHFPVLYRGARGLVAHECILDLRPTRRSCGITEEDVAKRLMDYGLHAPTISFPVPGTMMVEPTESEPLQELERFCDAMIAIRGEIAAVERGEVALDDSPLRRAPHTLADLTDPGWDRPYSRMEAVAPAGEGQLGRKVWPPVNRIDNVHGDRNLFCACPPWGEATGDAEAAQDIAAGGA